MVRPSLLLKRTHAHIHGRADLEQESAVDRPRKGPRELDLLEP